MRAMGWIVPLALVAGCHKGPEVHADNAIVAEVRDKVQAATANGAGWLKPGAWKATMTMDEMSLPGLPPEAAARMKQVTASAHDMDSCLTPEQARKPGADFWGGKEKNCQYDHFDMADGKIDIAMTCSGDAEGRGAMTMAMNGRYAPDDYHLAMQSRAETGPGGMGPMTMKMHLDAKRVGDRCSDDGKESNG